MQVGPQATSWSRAPRKPGCSVTSRKRAARRRRSGSSTSARRAAGQPRRSPPRPRSPRCSPLAECPSPRRCRASSYRSEGRLLIVGPAEAALQVGEAPVLAAWRHGSRHRTGERRGASRRSARTPFIPEASRKCPAGLAPSRCRGRRKIPSTSTSAHAAMRACARVPRAPSISRTRSTSIAARITASASPRAERRPPSTSRARDVARSESFDLVLDLGQVPHLSMHQPPQGYLAPGADPLAQAVAVTEIATLTGEFEKPKYFAYKASICAHSRSRQPGCNLCLDVCSTAAIDPDGDHVKVQPSFAWGAARARPCALRAR